MQKRKRVDLSNPPSKKRKRTFAVEEIVYDAADREDYLTGFHKRKLQRAKRAREEAAKKEKAERIEARRNVSYVFYDDFGESWSNLACDSYARPAERISRSMSRR